MAAAAPVTSAPPVVPLPSATLVPLPSVPTALSASSWLATASATSKDYTLPAPWIRTGANSWLAIMDGSKKMTDLYAACGSHLEQLDHISFRRLQQSDAMSTKMRYLLALVEKVQNMSVEGVAALFDPEVVKSSVALCRLRRGRDMKAPVGLDFVLMGSEHSSKKYERISALDCIPDDLRLHCPIWPSFVASTEMQLGEYAHPVHLNRWRLDSKFPMIYVAFIRCWDGIVRGYVGQATRLSYRWNTCATSTINSHLSGHGVWGILSELRQGSLPIAYQLIDIAVAYAAAWQRSGLPKDRSVAEHVADTGGVWLFVLHSWGKAASSDEVDQMEARWVHALRSDDPSVGLNQAGRTRVPEVPIDAP